MPTITRPARSPRPPLPAPVIERIRRERLDPRLTQGDYLHLADLRRTLARTFGALQLPDGPALDLFCGAQPYRKLVPVRPLWGLDIDQHFGSADILGDGAALPFADNTFALVVCTQALHMATSLEMTVGEMHRVLAKGGVAVITVPYFFRLEHPDERRLTRETLGALFAEWQVTIGGLAGSGVGLASYPGTLLLGGARRWSALRPLAAPVAVALNALGAACELITRPFASRWPSGWLVIARRRDG